MEKFVLEAVMNYVTFKIFWYTPIDIDLSDLATTKTQNKCTDVVELI